MNRHPALFTPIPLGRHTLRNRIVLPPLTRQRTAQPWDVPTALMARYYAQRAGAGFMVSEGAQIEPRGQGYGWTPGIYSEAQIATVQRIARRLETGGVFINGFSAFNARIPVGGAKKSGYGRELSHFGLREFTNAQSVWAKAYS